MMIRRVSDKMDLSKPVVVAEYGPGEGCHTREMLKRAHPESKFLLFELDPEFCQDLRRQFADDPRVTVVNGDAATLPEELAKQDLSHCDYVLSGIPFSILETEKKRQLLQKTYDAIVPGGAFVIYQVTNELRRHANKPELFPRADSEYFLQTCRRCLSRSSTRMRNPRSARTATATAPTAITRGTANDAPVRTGPSRLLPLADLRRV